MVEVKPFRFDNLHHVQSSVPDLVLHLRRTTTRDKIYHLDFIIQE